jgi:hypothetical protein
VVGGTVADIQQAPWQVALLQDRGNRFSLCGGSIVDALHVVTAAHCVFEMNGSPVAPSTLSIRAGISNWRTPRTTDLQQIRNVTGYRVHPAYAFTSTLGADDVAVLNLDTPLDLSGAQVRAIALPNPGLTLAGGETATLLGFGRQQANVDPDGSLNAFDGDLHDPLRCGDENAVLLCASSRASAVCSGDSGSALTMSSNRVMIGIASTGAEGCRAGGIAVFTNVAAPEILAFIQGSDTPPQAPRRQATVRLESPIASQVGQSLTCTPGEWTGAPTYVYSFLDDRSGAVLQKGAVATYKLQVRDVGRTITCRVAATNPGGTGVDEANSASGTVRAAPVLTAAPTGPARRGRSMLLRVTLKGVKDLNGFVEVCAAPKSRVGAKVCRTTRLIPSAGFARVSLPVTIKSTAPAARVGVPVTAKLLDGRKLRTTGVIKIV